MMFTGSGEWHLPGGHANPELKPGHDGGTVPESERSAGLHGFLQQFVLLLLPTVKVALPRQTTDPSHAVRLKKTRSNHQSTCSWSTQQVGGQYVPFVPPAPSRSLQSGVVLIEVLSQSLHFETSIPCPSCQIFCKQTNLCCFEPSQEKKYSTFQERI